MGMIRNAGRGLWTLGTVALPLAFAHYFGERADKAWQRRDFQIAKLLEDAMQREHSLLVKEGERAGGIYESGLRPYEGLNVGLQKDMETILGNIKTIDEEMTLYERLRRVGDRLDKIGNDLEEKLEKNETLNDLADNPFSRFFKELHGKETDPVKAEQIKKSARNYLEDITKLYDLDVDNKQKARMAVEKINDILEGKGDYKGLPPLPQEVKETLEYLRGRANEGEDLGALIRRAQKSNLDELMRKNLELTERYRQELERAEAETKDHREIAGKLFGEYRQISDTIQQMRNAAARDITDYKNRVKEYFDKTIANLEESQKVIKGKMEAMGYDFDKYERSMIYYSILALGGLMSAALGYAAFKGRKVRRLGNAMKDLRLSNDRLNRRLDGLEYNDDRLHLMRDPEGKIVNEADFYNSLKERINGSLLAAHFYFGDDKIKFEEYHANVECWIEEADRVHKQFMKDRNISRAEKELNGIFDKAAEYMRNLNKLAEQYNPNNNGGK